MNARRVSSRSETMFLFIFVVVFGFSIDSSTQCTDKEFTCDNGMCVLYTYRCDGDYDCTDRSDEKCDPILDYFLMVADNGKNKDIFQIDLNTGVLLPLRLPRRDFRDTASVVAIAFDQAKGDIYWADSDYALIKRSSILDRTKTIDTVFRVDGTLLGLALDAEREKLYYSLSDTATSNHGVIREMSLNGSDHRTIVSGPGKPQSLVLDTVNRLIYWADSGASPAIVRARIEDGRQRTVLVSTNISQPTALAIDFQDRILYWGDAFYHRIESINLTNMGHRQLVLDEDAVNATYSGFAIDDNFLFLTDRKRGSLRKVDLRTSAVSDQFHYDIFSRLGAIAIYNSRGATPLAGTTQLSTVSPIRLSTVNLSMANQTAGPIVSVTEIRVSPFKDTSIVAVVVVVVGVVLMTIVITVGVVNVKAKRTKKRLLLEKRLVAPPVQRGINSYYYSPFDDTLGGPETLRGANGEAPSSSFMSSPFARGAATRSSSFKPIIGEDTLGLNNVYSTIPGDYENIDTYEIIEDPVV